MRTTTLLLLCVAVYSLEAAIGSRHKRFIDRLKFKSFKMTRRPDSPPPAVEDEQVPDTPDTSFVVEKPPATMRPQFIDTTPRLTLEQKFNMELAAHGVRTTTQPSYMQTTAGGLWDFL